MEARVVDIQTPCRPVAARPPCRSRRSVGGGAGKSRSRHTAGYTTGAIGNYGQGMGLATTGVMAPAGQWKW